MSNVLYTLPGYSDSLGIISISRGIHTRNGNTQRLYTTGAENWFSCVQQAFLHARLKQLTNEKRFVVLLGDFNIFATDQDLYNPTSNIWND
jgi:hypothetical protein